MIALMDVGINLERQRSILAMVGNGFDAASIAKNLVLPLDTVQKVIDNKNMIQTVGRS